jgi:murein DD-endopeptidase MepM/ murein hydrolase activator NlpD
LRVGVVRAGAYGVLAAAVVIALRYLPQLPERRPSELIQQAAVPSWALKIDTLKLNENLQVLLESGGLPDSLAAAAVKAAPLNPRRIPSGMQVRIRTEHPDSAASQIELQLAVDRIIKLRREGGTWIGTEETLPWTTDTIVVGGSIQSNLYAAVDVSAEDLLPGGARQQLTYELADVYQYRVDMSRDLQRGDEFKVIAERAVAPGGAVRISRIIAAHFSLSGSVINAVRFIASGGDEKGEFFDQSGKSLKAAFLRAPLEFRRISSTFGPRVHPVLGGARMHKGTDYAAASGTPVRAIGAGTVVRAGWGNGYGNVIEIRHASGGSGTFVTRYGHLKGFAKGIHAGARVSVGDEIGYVGSTGLSTGPHLHFETLVDGQQRDPRTEIRRRQSTGNPIVGQELASFMSLRDRMVAILDGAGMGAQALASR